MRNHDEKARDMARSVLPSSSRKSARRRRALIHRRERAELRGALHELRSIDDPDDFEGDLTLMRQRAIKEMVWRRRDGDKIAPLIRWARHTVENDPALAAGSPQDRELHFRAILPAGLIGDHAISHLYRVIHGERRRGYGSGTYRGQRPLVELVAELVAAGYHGDLNRRIRASVPLYVRHQVRLSPQRLIDDEHPSPGVVLPPRWVEEIRRRDTRYLAGAHDIRAFAKESDRYVKEIVRNFYAEVFG